MELSDNKNKQNGMNTTNEEEKWMLVCSDDIKTAQGEMLKKKISAWMWFLT